MMTATVSLQAYFDKGAVDSPNWSAKAGLVAPVLCPDQIERIRPYAKARYAEPGEILYEPNDESQSVFVVESGLLRILALAEMESHLVISFGAGQFTGDVLVIAGRRSIFRCEVAEPSVLLELTTSDLRAMIGKDSELSDIFVSAFLARRLMMRDSGLGNVLLLGARHSARTLEVREFLIRDGHPFAYIDVDVDEEGKGLLDHFGAAREDVPVVVCNRSQVLRNPSPREVGEALGFNDSIKCGKVWDLVVIGAGPGGLAAAVYGASEGLGVLVVEKAAPGGQAASSSKIENYLGFPTGLTGRDLASRAIAQAEKFGAQIMVACNVQRLSCETRPYRLTLDDGQQIAAHTVVFATGAQYNRPLASNADEYTGKGVYYSATFMEVQACDNEEVIVIGGGNSAGQAAVFLAQHTKRVHLLVRSEGLCRSMSNYLIQRIEENPNICVRYCTELISLTGEDHLNGVAWRDKSTGTVTSAPIRHVFVMAGASPKTDWLSGCLALDRSGFILTGRDVETQPPPTVWPLSRRPHMLETNLPGVFAVGDARSGSLKRVTSAVGEGAIVVSLVHEVLAESEAFA